MNTPEWQQLFYYISAGLVLHWAYEVAKVLLDDSMWTHSPCPTWKDVVLGKRRSKRGLMYWLSHAK